MKTEVIIRDLVIDNADVIIKELKNGKNFKLTIYDGTNEEPAVGMWLEHIDRNKECTIMFEIPKDPISE